MDSLIIPKFLSHYRYMTVLGILPTIKAGQFWNSVSFSGPPGLRASGLLWCLGRVEDRGGGLEAFWVVTGLMSSVGPTCAVMRSELLGCLQGLLLLGRLG